MTIFLIRHASAGTRSPSDDDLDRPLDQKGEAQTQAIVELLGQRGITDIYSSRAVRCVTTVEPLAEHLGLEIMTHDSLVEGQSATMAVHLLQTLAREDKTAALCSHGDIIPDSIQRLAREGMSIVGTRGWAKGSTWQLDTRGGDIVSASYLGPF